MMSFFIISIECRDTSSWAARGAATCTGTAQGRSRSSILASRATAELVVLADTDLGVPDVRRLHACLAVAAGYVRARDLWTPTVVNMQDARRRI